MSNIDKTRYTVKDLYDLRLGSPLIYHMLVRYELGHISFEDMLISLVVLLNNQLDASNQALVNCVQSPLPSVKPLE